jgi:hypothetical protein
MRYIKVTLSTNYVDVDSTTEKIFGVADGVTDVIHRYCNGLAFPGYFLSIEELGNKTLKEIEEEYGEVSGIIR